jgi:hypothetical protein
VNGVFFCIETETMYPTSTRQTENGTRVGKTPQHVPEIICIYLLFFLSLDFYLLPALFSLSFFPSFLGKFLAFEKPESLLSL